MKREEVKEFDMVKLKDGRIGVVVDMWSGGNQFEFEYIVDEENQHWEEETCKFDDIVEVLDSQKK